MKNIIFDDNDPRLMGDAKKKAMLKAWEECKPKLIRGSIGIPMIFGTGGEQPVISEKDFKKLWGKTDEATKNLDI